MNHERTRKKTVFSGIRPTGPAHLGNYAGAMRNWVHLQDEYRCFYSIVTWHALSSEYQNSKVIKGYTLEMAVDLAQHRPRSRKCVLFVQSEVKEHAELHLLLSMITPLPWVERVPTFKDMQKELADKDLNTYGYLGYPVLQTADIIIYKADIVPVGEDQAAHLELAREITRRFNRLYRRGLSRAADAPDRDAAAGRHGRPEDEQVVRQRHLPQGPAGSHPGEDRSHGHRHPAQTPLRPRRTR